LGDPGAGKSCLLQALTLRWAEQPELERQHLDLPLLIELRAYAQARERDHINGFLDFWQRSPLGHLEKPCYEKIGLLIPAKSPDIR
ncbi:MAG: hypothetical protein V9G98_13065, partial [Candidatus Competibacter sp.]